MNNLVKALRKEDTKTTTENGMKTFSTSLNACTDMFFLGGVSRTKTEYEIAKIALAALNEDVETAIKVAAYIRDPRGGNGERRFFREFLKSFDKYVDDKSVKLNLSQIGEIGRWDDLLTFVDTYLEKDAFEAIANSLHSKNALCAKWMPRKGEIANKLRKYMNLSPYDYRKLIVGLTNVVETQMCNNEWPAINYSHVPSVANVKYNKAFLRNDEVRRREFLAAAKKGTVKINSGVAFPHDIIKLVLDVYRGSNSRFAIQKNDTAIAMWKQLPNFLEGNARRILPVCDTSGSMSTNGGLPLYMSIALGMYISERNVGPFQNAYMTFSATPDIVFTRGDLYERIVQMPRFHPSNTNLEATFIRLLEVANTNRITEDEMPTDILIISDMEFDRACSPNHSALKMIKRRYNAAGYEMPNIIFWNVNSRQENVPVRYDKEGTALISGGSPAAIIPILSGVTSPVQTMLKAINQEKYQKLIL